MTRKTILKILAALVFVAFEIYLFDYTTVARWIPWTLFLVVFAVALYLSGAIQGLFPAKSTVVNSNLPVSPLETKSTSLDKSSRKLYTADDMGKEVTVATPNGEGKYTVETREATQEEKQKQADALNRLYNQHEI